MNPRDPVGVKADLQGPDIAFQEPWQAQAFALAVNLHHGGLFSWGRWTEALGEALREEGEDNPEDRTEAYYRRWVSALERLLREEALISPKALAARQDEWASAYHRTPHGEPVELYLRRA